MAQITNLNRFRKDRARAEKRRRLYNGRLECELLWFPTQQKGMIP